MLRLGISLFLLHSTLSYAQCNGSMELCSKKYDEVAYLTTHNAFNATDQGYTFPNQSIGITAQLDLGVRGFMLDVYDLNGVATTYHGFSFLGNAPLVSSLEEIRIFLDNNPTEIVTIIFESYVDANMIEAAMNDAGLSAFLYTKPAGQNWDTLEDMISANKRLVVFTDVDDAAAGQEWYHYVWDHAVETHFTVNSSAAFTNDYNRGNPVNDLFIFNHFVTSTALGTGILPEAQVVNEYAFLMNRIQGHFNEYAKFPNFITLDFVDEGNGKQVVDSLNASGFELSVSSLKDGDFSVAPNPASDFLRLSGLNPAQVYLVELLDMRGKLVLVQSVFGADDYSLDIRNLNKSAYILKISVDGKTLYNHKVLLQ